MALIDCSDCGQTISTHNPEHKCQRAGPLYYIIQEAGYSFLGEYTLPQLLLSQYFDRERKPIPDTSKALACLLEIGAILSMKPGETIPFGEPEGGLTITCHTAEEVGL